MEEKLLQLIKDEIKAKGTCPCVLTFSELRRASEPLGTKQELNKAFAKLRDKGKIKIRIGINQNLVEVV